MNTLAEDLDRARDLDVAALADAIQSIGFECTRCGACCKAETGGCGDSDGAESVEDVAGDPVNDADDASDAGYDDADADPHTATVFPDEVRRLQAAAAEAGEEPYDWRDVARPMPYGLREGEDGPAGETFEWALATDDCGDCTFYAAADERDAEVGACTVHADRPLICRTYPFSVALGGTSQPMGEVVDGAGPGLDGDRGQACDDDPEGSDDADLVRAHECEGLGRDIAREDAEELAAALKTRAVRELEEAIAVRDSYEPVDTDAGEVVVHDSEGAKRADGTPIDGDD